MLDIYNRSFDQTHPANDHDPNIYNDYLIRLCRKKYTQVTAIKTEHTLGRSCCFNNDLYLTCPSEDCIIGCTLDGHVVGKSCVDGVTWPRSLQPISSQHLVLAANRGLFVIEGEGREVHSLMKGNFLDAHCNDEYIVAIEHAAETGYWDNGDYNELDVIHVFSIHHPHKYAQFSFINGNARSIRISGDRIYISDWNTHQVSVYSLKGAKIGHFGRFRKLYSEPGDLYFPVVCICNKSGRILVADSGHQCLQMFYPGLGKWKVVSGLNLKEEPLDVIFVENKMLVLHYNGCTVFKIEDCV